jgi:hypothetical protein
VRYHRTDASSRASYRGRVREGVTLGLKIAVLFSVLALVAFMIGGNAALQVKGNPPIQRLLMVYAVGGVSGGAIAGALSRFASTDARAAIVGIIAVLPIDLALRFAGVGLAPWTRIDTMTQVIEALIYGVAGGSITRRVLLSRANQR